MSWRRLPALLALLALAGACSKEKDVEPPAELVDFRETLRIDRVWSVGMGGGEEVMRLALAPVADDTTAYLAGHDGDVAAVDLATGRSRWRRDLKIHLSAGPGAGEGIVVVGSPEGDVVALDAAGGAERWRVRLNGEILARPAVGGSMVVVHTVDGRVHGLKASDGTGVWSYEQPVPRLTLRGSAPPVVDRDVVLCAFDNGKVAALRLAEGDLLWSATVAAARGRTELARLVDIDSAVEVSGEDVFVVGFQGRVAMLALNSGQIWWARDMSSYRGLALDAGSLFVSTADGAVVSLSRRDGTEQWRQDAMRLRGLSAPAVDGEAIVVGDFEGYLHWLDRTSGALLARTRAGGDRISNPPVVVNGLVLVEDDGGTVSAYRSRPRG
jgi:outer membrane protein assembly factor BamB